MRVAPTAEPCAPLPSDEGTLAATAAPPGTQHPTLPTIVSPRRHVAEATTPQPTPAKALSVMGAGAASPALDRTLRKVIVIVGLLVLTTAGAALAYIGRFNPSATAGEVASTAVVLHPTNLPAPSATPQSRTATITVDGVRLREAPLNGAVRATLRRGTLVDITGEPVTVTSQKDLSWWPVRVGATTGWVSGRFLALSAQNEEEQR
jgi:hypothetical protein